MPRILISGASIAGPALAFWLQRYGCETTIVERAPELRPGGQNVDVRGAGREVARRMGIEDDIRAATTGEVGTRFIGRHGQTLAEFPAGTSDSGGATAELEILRGDLARLLVDRTAETTEYRFGDRITALDDDGDGVTASFETAPDERFDLVIAADGIGSSTRRLVFGDEPEIRSLGLETSYATLPRTAADDDWWRWYTADRGRSITLRPDSHGTLRVALSYLTERSAERRSVDEQRTRLREVFADAGWEAPRVLAGIDASDDLYFESIGQVHAPRWSSGRVALVGDAAYCASPVSGMGTSLSIAGAYVLAGELAAHVDHRDALAGYERRMRPYVDQAQKLPPGTPRLAHPVSRPGVTAFGLAVKLGASPLGSRLAARFATPPADAIDLPDYSHLER
ncbi:MULTISPECIES: FAD-dependent monooxygenase [unclassified Rathayibacter]|uniref:FAD-dependent monooxygenase n=1 Tax=unclassified Rathayibacter TaxID=2609250 RepID=UPI000701ADC9|nr:MULTISPECIES: FAD-dependent monooxygenase [unclassified Rathayibacter]KQQ05931.1 FAD-binding monooxygenase [Rathayibacter sp. Leaf294]KQS13788.1 FAD-binding monooxygenase [Rathayibacter sp. Leaf185]